MLPDCRFGSLLTRTAGVAAVIFVGFGHCHAEIEGVREAAREAFESAEALHASVAAGK